MVRSSPASSPESHKRHKKRPSDRFLELPATVEVPNDDGKVEAKSDHEESFVTHFFLPPIMMVSFLLSLFVVDRNQRAWRRSQHGSSSSSYFSIQPILSWLDPEPYQEPQDSTWQTDAPATTSDGGVPAAIKPKSEHWVHGKHRRLAKLTLGDALEMRGRVAIMMCAWALCGLAGTIWSLRTMYYWLT